MYNALYYANREISFKVTVMQIFDAHFHIIDPRFPLKANQGYLPAPFTAQMYEEVIKDYDITGGAIVSGSFQGFDQSYILDALQTLGEQYVGVVNLPNNASDEEIITLSRKRIRAVRFNIYRGGSKTINHLTLFAKRIYDLCGMHIELYISGEQINQHYDKLKTLPKFSIDHLGLTKDGQHQLLKLVEKGGYIKASGFMRIDFDAVKLMRKIIAINPNALLFGTDLPGTRASRIFSKQDIQLIEDHFSANEQKNIFKNNAVKYYGLNS